MHKLKISQSVKLGQRVTLKRKKKQQQQNLWQLSRKSKSMKIYTYYMD